jgi:hypothetical protein
VADRAGRAGEAAVRRPGAAGVTTALLVVAAVVAGCGGGHAKKAPPADPDRAAVARVLADLQAASRAGDGKRICNDIFTVKLANSITRSAASGSCAKEVRRNLFSPQTRISVQRVDVTAPSDATAIVTEENGNTSKVLLIKQAGQWRIRGVRPA